MPNIPSVITRSVLFSTSLLMLLVLYTLQVQAATFTVNSIGDDVDMSIDGTCDTGMLVGGQPECTLRAAVQEANATPVLDDIVFNITENCVNNICTINVTTAAGGFIPDILTPVNIDGSTQPGNAAVCTTDIPDRPAYRIVVHGDAIDIGLRLELGSDGSSIRGLNMRNFFNAIAIVRSDNNSIECNFIGSDENGTLAGPGNVQNGIILGCDSSGNVIGGASFADGNLLSANGVDGVQFFAGFDCAPTAGNVPRLNSVLGNFIGTQKDGISALGNVFDGIAFFGGDGAEDNFVGVLQNGVTINGNVIGANGAAGIFIDSQEGNSNGTDNTLIMGNYLGTDRTGTVDLGNAFGGVDIFTGTNNIIGGTLPGATNIFAFNSEGVFISDPVAFGNRIQRNNMYQNTGLGIDLVISGEDPDGQNANDPDDSDTGANGLQNFPEITSATQDASMVTINYSVPSVDLPLSIEFYQADLDNQEGQGFITEDSYTTPGTAMVIFPDSMIDLDAVIVATATDANGNTSEFSSSVNVVFLDLLFRDGYEQ